MCFFFNLKSELFPKESSFKEALAESERILRWRPDHAPALHVKAESLYAKCKVGDAASQMRNFVFR